MIASGGPRLCPRFPGSFVLGVALLLVGCLHPFRQSFSRSHEAHFPQIEEFAEMAEVVYENALAIQELCARQGYSQVVVKSFPDRDTRYFLATDTVTHRHLISVQGTANLKNALLDIEYDKTKDPLIGIRLHHGFHAAVESLFNDAIHRMDKRYTVSLTGHSLGGAEAVILGMYLHEKGWAVSRIVTFGQPKVTDADGAKKFRGLPLWRVVNVNDPVPLVPPLEFKYFKKPYTHLGVEITLLDGPYYSYLEEGDNADPVGVDFWESLKSKDEVKQNLPQHSMALYRANLSSKTKSAQEVPYADRMNYYQIDRSTPTLPSTFR
jgi:triacylglycerol lipase